MSNYLFKNDYQEKYKHNFSEPVVIWNTGNAGTLPVGGEFVALMATGSTTSTGLVIVSNDLLGVTGSTITTNVVTSTTFSTIEQVISSVTSSISLQDVTNNGATTSNKLFLDGGLDVKNTLKYTGTSSYNGDMYIKTNNSSGFITTGASYSGYISELSIKHDNVQISSSNYSDFTSYLVLDGNGNAILSSNSIFTSPSTITLNQSFPDDGLVEIKAPDIIEIKSSNISFSDYDGSKTFFLDNSTITTARTFNLPNLSGTFSLTGHTHSLSDIIGTSSLVTTNTTQTITGNKQFDDVRLIKKVSTGSYPTTSGGSFYIGGQTGNYDIFDFYSIDGSDSDGFGTSQIYSEPESGNYITHTSLDNQQGSILRINYGDTHLRHIVGGQQTSLYVNGITDKIIIEGTQNKFAALGTSLITGTKNFEFPNNSGTIALLSDIPSLSGYALTTDLLNYTQIATASTGVSIAFDRTRIYNLPASVGTGNITNNLTGAKIGIVQKIYHQQGTTPTFPAGWVKLSGDYSTTLLNIIYAEWVTGTRVEYWIINI